MEQYLEISAIDCFMGLVDAASYQGFLGEEVGYEQLEKHILKQMQVGHILFWGSTTPNRWTVQLVDQPKAKQAVQEFQGHLKVSDQGLYLVNYAMLLDAAQFKEDALTEQFLTPISLSPAWHQVTVRQLFHPDTEELSEESLGFEIVVQKMDNAPSQPANTLASIPWSIY